MGETIVAAALRIQLLAVSTSIENEPMIFSKPAPARHNHLVHEIAELLDRVIEPNEQGFLTSTGRYVGRDEAWQIASVAGQIVDTLCQPLFSESIW